MKHCLLLSILYFGLLLTSHAQDCPPIELALRSQADVDNFSVDYPTCTDIKRLIIEGDDITTLQGLEGITMCAFLYIQNLPNLQSLEGLTSIRRVIHLIIDSTGLTSLGGLESLDTVEFILNISRNDHLIDLSGLEAVTDVNGLYVSDNAALQSLQGLGSLKRLHNLSIEYCPSLINLTGMPALETLDALYLGNNTQLTDLSGIEQITLLENDLAIYSNPLLASLQGLQAIEKIRNIDIRGNSSLLNMSGLESLIQSTGNVNIHSNTSMVDLHGLNNLTSIDKQLEIFGNNSLQRLDGLNSLKTIGLDFLLRENAQLTDVTSLQQLTSVAGQLYISDNDNLESLSGLDNLSIIGNLEITFNNNLSACSVQSICQYLASGGPSQVGANLGGCANEAQILESCVVSSDDLASSPIPVFPNPAHSIVLLPERISDAVVFDVTGRKYQVEIIDARMDVSVFPSGIYMIRCEVNGAVKVASFVKM